MRIIIIITTIFSIIFTKYIILDLFEITAFTICTPQLNLGGGNQSIPLATFACNIK